MTLLRQKRDFGITAAIVAAIAISAAAAVTAGVAMANQVAAATAINQITEQTAEALQTLQRVDALLSSEILILNKRVDILQQSVEALTDVVQLNCISFTKHMCITALQFDNGTSVQSTTLSNYLKKNWSQEIERLQRKLQLEIISLNGTHLKPVTFGDLTSWLASAFSYFKEWMGVGMFGAVLCCGLALGLWLVCKIRNQQHRDKVLITQTLLAIEQGTSPQTWLSMLKQ